MRFCRQRLCPLMPAWGWGLPLRPIVAVLLAGVALVVAGEWVRDYAAHAPALGTVINPIVLARVFEFCRNGLRDRCVASAAVRLTMEAAAPMLEAVTGRRPGAREIWWAARPE